jgi:hypothetical protein
LRASSRSYSVSSPPTERTMFGLALKASIGVLRRREPEALRPGPDHRELDARLRHRHDSRLFSPRMGTPALDPRYRDFQSEGGPLRIGRYRRLSSGNPCRLERNRRSPPGALSLFESIALDRSRQVVGKWPAPRRWVRVAATPFMRVVDVAGSLTPVPPAPPTPWRSSWRRSEGHRCHDAAAHGLGRSGFVLYPAN